MDGQTLELWFWTMLDALILHLRQIRLTLLTWAAEWGFLEIPEPPWWAWLALPALTFGLGLLIGLALPSIA